MNPEDHLEEVLAQRTPADPDNDAEATRLAAADAVQQMRRMDLPLAFADRLEQQVRRQAEVIAQPGGQLRQHGVVRLRLRPLPRITVVVASVFMVLLLTGGILVYAAAQSLPGDWLYGLKQWGNQIALSQAQSPAAKAEVAIQQLHSALVDLQTEVSQHRSDADISQALSMVAAATQHARSAVAAIPAGTARAKAQTDLAQAIIDESTTLHHLLMQIDWPSKVAFTTQLGALGDEVPQITSVTVAVPNTGAVHLVIHGIHFTAGAQVVLDGQVIGTPQTATSSTLVTSISAVLWGNRDHLVGVLNSGGTAAEIHVVNGHPGQSSGNGHPTPKPEPTPGNGNGHHGTPTPSSPGHHGKEGESDKLAARR